MIDESKCPKCGVPSETCVHQSEGTFAGIAAHIVDMGWKCPKCGHEWGFENEELGEEKKKIDSMSQEEMASLWRYAPAGHPYFVSGSELCHHFNTRFKGFTPEISKAIERGRG